MSAARSLATMPAPCAAVHVQERWTAPRKLPPRPSDEWLATFVPPPRRRRFSAPVWTDCGDPHCPRRECARAIARREQAEHTRVARRTTSKVSPSQVWLKETSRHAKPAAARVTPERASRANFAPKERERVHRPLTPEELTGALSALERWPIRRKHLDDPSAPLHSSRWDWTHEVWLELVTPPADVAPAQDFQTRLRRSIWRAEKHIDSQQGDFVASSDRYSNKE